MLRDEERTLIASAVDGPLMGADAARFRDLVANNPEANSLYFSLVADRDRLAALPKWPAPYSIAQTISQRIYPQAVPATKRTTKSLIATWLPYAIAASVFITLSAGSFVIFNRESKQGEFARQSPKQPSPEILPQRPDSGNSFASGSNREELPDPNNEHLPLPSTPAVANRDVKPGTDLVKPRNEIESEWLTARIPGAVPDPQSVSARLPLLFNVADAAQADVQKKIREEYFASTAVRLDLFVRDMPKAIEALQASAKSSGLTTTVAVQTTEQIKRKLPISIAIYTESFNANEHVAFLVKLATADATSNAFTQAHLVPATAVDVKDLKTLFGVDPGLGKQSKGDEGVDSSVSSGTLNQLKQAIAKEQAKTAIATTYGPAGLRFSPNNSTDIKSYFEKRGERPASAIPAMIVIRPIVEK